MAYMLKSMYGRKQAVIVLVNWVHDGVGSSLEESYVRGVVSYLTEISKK